MNAVLEQLKQYFENTPQDIIEEEWNKFCSYDNVGPTIDEFLSFTNEESVKWKNPLAETGKK